MSGGGALPMPHWGFSLGPSTACCWFQEASALGVSKTLRDHTLLDLRKENDIAPHAPVDVYGPELLPRIFY